MADKSEKSESKSKLVVTAALVSFKGPDGKFVHLYRGASVDGFDADDVKRHEDLGMVGKGDDIVPGTGFDPSDA